VSKGSTWQALPGTVNERQLAPGMVVPVVGLGTWQALVASPDPDGVVETMLDSGARLWQRR
jgi:hypothetical protein